jgi:hypothetical protein
MKDIPGKKIVQFALLLTVPAVMSGCTDYSSSQQCYDANNDGYCDNNSGGGTYYSTGGRATGSGKSYTSGSNSESHSGFGSGGAHSSFFGG